MRINGKHYSYSYFVFDGCHKIYLIHKKDFKDIAKEGYSRDNIFPVSELETVFKCSCPLRFISRWDNVFDDVVKQCENMPLIQAD